MQRHDMIDTMRGLGLKGMAAAFDEALLLRPNDEQAEHALELMPEIVGDESVGQKYAINGLLSLTVDLAVSPDRLERLTSKLAARTE